ncbi:hypothetical protein [Kingella potus]|uniref:hypothetical protein n=1 Tax=Kingella potus TaxID=265175 RepID=UPI001FD008FA|nr:hypothetical protein [Kingella potus]UOO99894.1 hypothetical protein LVJ84_07395 [Kingella potus]
MCTDETSGNRFRRTVIRKVRLQTAFAVKVGCAVPAVHAFEPFECRGRLKPSNRVRGCATHPT